MIKNEAEAKEEEPRRGFWHNDGPNDQVNSLQILLDWMTTESNYTKWKGSDNNSGITKKPWLPKFYKSFE